MPAFEASITEGLEVQWRGEGRGRWVMVNVIAQLYHLQRAPTHVIGYCSSDGAQMFDLLWRYHKRLNRIGKIVRSWSFPS